MTGEHAADRRVFRVTGRDRVQFLQGMVSNDVSRLGVPDGPRIVYAALLTPQGKYLADFFIVAQEDAILLDIKDILVEDCMRKLTMFKLRADVTIEPAGLHVQRGLGTPPADAHSDPRAETLGWRRYAPEPGDPPTIDWDALRVAACVPESGVELIPAETFILEAGFSRLNGVDFRKGCYVGQEVTARMRHKTELRKGLATVDVEGSAPVGTEILSGGKHAGRLFTQAAGQGIAYLRFDRANGEMHAADAVVRLPA